MQDNARSKAAVLGDQTTKQDKTYESSEPQLLDETLPRRIQHWRRLVLVKSSDVLTRGLWVH
jgi:hypothetical protein